MHTKFWWYLLEINHLEDLEVYGRWMELAQDHVQQQALVLVVLNLWLCYKSIR